MFDEPMDEARSEVASPVGEQPSRSSRTRLAVGALVTAAALGGLGAGVAWAADDAEDPVPTEDPTDDRRGCGRKGSTDTSLL